MRTSRRVKHRHPRTDSPSSGRPLIRFWPCEIPFGLIERVTPRLFKSFRRFSFELPLAGQASFFPSRSVKTRMIRHECDFLLALHPLQRFEELLPHVFLPSAARRFFFSGLVKKLSRSGALLSPHSGTLTHNVVAPHSRRIMPLTISSLLVIRELQNRRWRVAPLPTLPFTLVPYIGEEFPYLSKRVFLTSFCRGRWIFIPGCAVLFPFQSSPCSLFFS